MFVESEKRRNVAHYVAFWIEFQLKIFQAGTDKYFFTYLTEKSLATNTFFWLEKLEEIKAFSRLFTKKFWYRNLECMLWSWEYV